MVISLFAVFGWFLGGVHHWLAILRYSTQVVSHSPFDNTCDGGNLGVRSSLGFQRSDCLTRGWGEDPDKIEAVIPRGSIWFPFGNSEHLHTLSPHT